jgi:hypothetical protein
MEPDPIQRKIVAIYSPKDPIHAIAAILSIPTAGDPKQIYLIMTGTAVLMSHGHITL